MSEAYADRGRFDVEVVYDVRISTPDGVQLSADLYLPREAGVTPGIMSAYPYPKESMTEFLEDTLRGFAERGYATLIADLRGTGSSDGVPWPRGDGRETDDALAIIDWMARQPWCDGNIGMWGSSYGGGLAMRTASRHPTWLKAIIPMMSSADSRRYGQERGDLGVIAQWGGMMLAEQLLPPLRDHTSPDAEMRWQQRLNEIEPVILDLARHGPRHPVWSERAVDAASVAVPTFCVGGWRDMYRDVAVRTFEQLRGPKKLLMGPWGHEMPNDSPFEPIDFVAAAVRWWDHWLRGDDNGVLEEPPITVYLMGPGEGWRALEAWPPADGELVLATGSDTRLVESSLAAPRLDGIAEYHPDPTIGASNGPETGGLARPVDQHDDDVRSIMATSDPVKQSLLIVGRPVVLVRVATGEATRTEGARRLVVRLNEVDADGRSTPITSAVHTIDDSTRDQYVELEAVARRVSSGRRLRVAISDSDFPRLTPLANPSSISVAGVQVSVPLASGELGIAAVPLPRDAKTATGHGAPGVRTTVLGGRWSTTRDLVNDAVEVHIGGSTQGTRTSQGHVLHAHGDVRATVRRAAPDGAESAGKHVWLVQMEDGETFEVSATVRCTQRAVWARGEVKVGGLTKFCRTWEAVLAD